MPDEAVWLPGVTPAVDPVVLPGVVPRGFDVPEVGPVWLPGVTPAVDPVVLPGVVPRGFDVPEVGPVWLAGVTPAVDPRALPDVLVRGSDVPEVAPIGLSGATRAVEACDPPGVVVRAFDVPEIAPPRCMLPKLPIPTVVCAFDVPEVAPGRPPENTPAVNPRALPEVPALALDVPEVALMRLPDAMRDVNPLAAPGAAVRAFDVPEEVVRPGNRARLAPEGTLPVLDRLDVEPTRPALPELKLERLGALELVARPAPDDLPPPEVPRAWLISVMTSPTASAAAVLSKRFMINSLAASQRTMFRGAGLLRGPPRLSAHASGASTSLIASGT